MDTSVRPYSLQALRKRWVDFKSIAVWSNFAPAEIKQHLYFVVLLDDIVSAAKEHKDG